MSALLVVGGVALGAVVTVSVKRFFDVAAEEIEKFN